MKHLILLSLTLLALASCDRVNPMLDEVVPTEIPTPNDQPTSIETESEVLNDTFRFLEVQYESTQSFKEIISDETGYTVMLEIFKTPNHTPKALQRAHDKIRNSGEISQENKETLLSALTRILKDPNLSDVAWLSGLKAEEASKTQDFLTVINLAPPNRKAEVIKIIFDKILRDGTPRPNYQPLETESAVLNDIFRFLAVQHASTQSFREIISDQMGYIIMLEIFKIPDDVPKALQRARSEIGNSQEISRQHKDRILPALTHILKDPNLSDVAWLSGLKAEEAMETIDLFTVIHLAPSNNKEEVIKILFDKILGEIQVDEILDEETPGEETPMEETLIEGTTIQPSY